MFRRIAITFLISLALLAPASAASNPPNLIGGTLLPGTQTEVQDAIAEIGEEQNEGLNDAEKELRWFQEVLLSNVINTLIGWTAALAVLFLVIGGYQYLTAGGNEESIKKAHKTFAWSLGGVLLALLAFALVQILVNINFSAPKEADANLLAADLSTQFSNEIGQIVPFSNNNGWDDERAAEVKLLPQSNFRDEFLPVVTRFLLYAMTITSFVVFMYAGTMLVLGWGDEEKTKKSKQMIIWGLTGIGLAAAAYVLVKGVLGFDFL